MQGGDGRFARVVIPSPLKDPLIYKIPASFQDDLRIGMRVQVPLGRQNVTGVVSEFLAESSLTQVKEISALLDDRPILDASLLELTRWISQYYLTPLGEALGTVLPPGLRTKVERTILAKPGEHSVRGKTERQILEELGKRKGKTAIKILSRKFPSTALYRALDRLESIGAIEIREQTPRRRKVKTSHPWPLLPTPLTEPKVLSLTTAQENALQAVQQQLEKGGFETYLLYGVTGSGKTEIYLRVMEWARKGKKRSLILIPEISLTPQLLDRLRQRFGDKTGVLHSGLTPAERWAQWWRILRGEVDVVIGARSAVFAPIPDLGLIVVDEEHDPSYKQEEGVRYNGRDIAVVRGKLAGCPVILGSATPAVESFQNVLQGRYRLLELTERPLKQSLPVVDIIDLRAKPYPTQQPKNFSASRSDSAARFFSPGLVEAIQENHREGRQSLIFVNRRGFANFLQCSLCGHVVRCPYCSVTMTFHLKEKSVICHHCAFSKPAADHCPECTHPTLSGIGFGTEKVEQELQRLMPRARIARMDRDTTSQRGSQERIIRQWERGEVDILVGTQMITKGHDVSGVTLVGAILADLSLNIPDFRAAERTFQLLSQVAGRAGRGRAPGRVMIQTYAPDHYAIRRVIDHDYRGFFASEIEFRRALNYPPFTRLVHLRLEGPKANEVSAKAQTLSTTLREKQKRDPLISENIEILGPAPAPIEKLRNRYRWQILLKGRQSAALLNLTKQAREMVRLSRAMRLHVDVDPYNML